MIIVGTAIIEEWLTLINRFITPAEKIAITVHLMQNKQRPRVTIARATPAQVSAFIAKVANLIAAQRKADKKITDEAAEAARIQAELEANPPDPDAVRKPRTKRRAKPKAERPPSKKALEWLEQAAQVLTERRIKNGEKLDYNSAYNTSLYELKAGTFNPDHWKECKQLSEDHLQNIPTTTEDTKVRSYAYPDQDNIRTLATYGNGSPAEAPPRYSGNSMDGAFRDTLLVWKRLTFEYVTPFEPGAIEPTFIQIDGTLTAFSDRRGSAPMLSYIAKTWGVKKESSRLTTVGPPTDKPWSFYYRFKIPDVPPPYYAANEVKKATRTMRQPRHEETDGKLAKAVVIIAPRPMYGRGFNNNVTVTTQFDPTVKIWQIRPQLKMKLLIADENNGAILYNGSTFTTLHDNAAEPGGWFAPRSIAAGPTSYCAAQPDRGVFTFYDRAWGPTATVSHSLFLPLSTAFMDGKFWCATQPYDADTASADPANAWAVHIYDETGTLLMSLPTGIWGAKILTFANDSIWMIGRPTAALNRLKIEQWDATFTKLREWEINEAGTIDFAGIAASETELYLTMGDYVLDTANFVRKYSFDGALLDASFEIPPNDSVDGDWLTALHGCAWFKDTLWTLDSRTGSTNNKQLVAYNPDLTIQQAVMMTADPYTTIFGASLDRFGD